MVDIDLEELQKRLKKFYPDFTVMKKNDERVELWLGKKFVFYWDPRRISNEMIFHFVDYLTLSWRVAHSSS